MRLLARIPMWVWPLVIRDALRRLWHRRRPPPLPDLSGAELDFFFGGTDAVKARLVDPSFRFFTPADFDSSSVVDHCELILAHRLSLLGFGPVDVGDPIHWRCDFNTGYEWPRAHISKLTLVTREGDVKVPWELSRFHHGLTLALGYAATQDERYPREWAAQFQAWRADNPPEFGLDWGNAMEAALRAVNWIAAFTLMRAAFDQAMAESVFKALIQHGRFIASHLEEYWPPTNHILSNYCGLIWLGLFLRSTSDDKRASREPEQWLALGLRGLEQQLRFQILPDGASYEASTAYHRFVTEMVVSTTRLCEINNMFISSQVRETVAKMQAVVEGLRKLDGTLPLFGDEDGGRWLLPTLTLPRQNNTGGGGGSRRDKDWASFPHAGWYIHREGDEYLAIRAGDNGQAGWGGHAHNDALSFEYTIGSRTFFVDPGTYVYTSDPETRNLFRSTAYHNTLRVDGQEISRIPSGELFRLENDVNVRVRAGSESWDGEHSGYCHTGVTHQRRYKKHLTGWLIGDTVKGESEHTLEWFFHFAAACSVKMGDLRVWTEFDDGPNVRLETTNDKLQLRIEEGWVSPVYGRREAASIAVYALRAELPVTVEFIITKL